MFLPSHVYSSCLTDQNSPEGGTDHGGTETDKGGRESSPLCLSGYEEGKMTSEDGEQCLYSAVQCWGDMWAVILGDKKVSN